MSTFSRPVFAVFTLSILIVCVAFVYRRAPPSISSIQYDKTSQRLVDPTNSRMVVRFTSNIDSAVVDITPKAKITSELTGRTLDVTFGEPLRYAQIYRVTITTRAGQSYRSKDISFRTSNPSAFYLERSRSSNQNSAFYISTTYDDRILYLSSPGTTPVSVVEDREITVFDATSQAIVYATHRDSSDRLIYTKGKLSRDDLLVEGERVLAISMGVNGFAIITRLENSQTTQAARASLNNTVYYYDYTSLKRTTLPSNTANDVLRASDISYTPDGKLLIAKQLNGLIVVVDPKTKNDPAVIGTLNDLPSLSYDQSSLVGHSVEGWKFYDLQTQAFSGPIMPLDWLISTQFLTKNILVGYQNYDPTINKAQANVFTYDINTKSLSPIPINNLSDYSISHLSVSQNGEFIGVEVAGLTGAQYDLYKVNPRAVNTETIIFNTTHSEIVDRFKGIDFRWTRY